MKNLCPEFENVSESISFFINTTINSISNETFTDYVIELLEKKDENGLNTTEVEVLEKVLVACK